MLTKCVYSEHASIFHTMQKAVLTLLPCARRPASEDVRRPAEIRSRPQGAQSRAALQVSPHSAAAAGPRQDRYSLTPVPHVQIIGSNKANPLDWIMLLSSVMQGGHLDSWHLRSNILWDANDHCNIYLKTMCLSVSTQIPIRKTSSPWRRYVSIRRSEVLVRKSTIRRLQLFHHFPCRCSC